MFNRSSWVDKTDSGIHSGTNLPLLTITNTASSLNGNQYRTIVSNSLYVCDTETTDVAILTVNVQSVITNRRITYRVKKN